MDLWFFVIAALQLVVMSVLIVLFLKRSGDQQRMSLLADLRALLAATQQDMRRSTAEEIDRLRLEHAHHHRDLRTEVAANIRGVSDQQLQQLDLLSRQWGSLNEANEKRMRELQVSVEQRLTHIQQSNNERLEAMRQTVEEKLQGTLERRLGESFKMVGDRLEQVQRGLGEMQALATGVGDLKRVLTNVKTRGTWGEVQLSMLLEQVLTPDQYEGNSKLGRRTNDIVEFAVKLPGRDDLGSTVYLPIDSKFPQEQYLRILAAQDAGDVESLELSRRELEQALKVAARDIRDKYIHPPQTTDFAILFLPTESLFAEVMRIPGMCERMQVDYRVTVAGPTTLAALLNSLQMGFKSLAIQKRSSDVWRVLGAVKAEFGKFGDLLDGVQKKLSEAAHKIDDASKKSRNIESKLRGVEVIPAAEAQILLQSSEPELDF